MNCSSITILEITAGWHELVVLWHFLRPSIDNWAHSAAWQIYHCPN